MLKGPQPSNAPHELRRRIAARMIPVVMIPAVMIKDQ